MADKSVTVRMAPEEYEKIEALWRRAGFKSLQEAGLHAYRTAFQQGPEDPDVPVRHRPCVKKLREILASGDETLIGLVVTPLEYAWKLLRAGGAARKDGK